MLDLPLDRDCNTILLLSMSIVFIYYCVVTGHRLCYIQSWFILRKIIPNGLELLRRQTMKGKERNRKTEKSQGLYKSCQLQKPMVLVLQNLHHNLIKKCRVRKFPKCSLQIKTHRCQNLERLACSKITCLFVLIKAAGSLREEFTSRSLNNDEP